ncbi:MAG TPA: enoyl-CoA hydratase/isomerase family protein [Pyrinomonadaceae bacterium]|nr:enoyl-CoA hydratase/isomerase family protein [Pyrinomonadaceae bacterium]
MTFIEIETAEEIATLTLNRGKVNAISGALMEELDLCLSELANKSAIRAIVLTGRDKFFSFGFDVPEILKFTRQDFVKYATDFTRLYRKLFLFPKPVIASLNGHTVAGGCMLALTCDTRIMVSGNAKISLNEITFGSSVFAGSTEMLRSLVGTSHAAEILYSGAMYSAEEAHGLGLVETVSTEETLREDTKRIASALAAKDPTAFASIKSLLRKEVGESMKRRDADSVEEMVDIWFSEATRAHLKNIQIHS